MSEPKFKVGDTVRCIKGDGGYPGEGWENGSEFTIKSMGNSGYELHYYKRGNKDTVLQGVFEDYLELVEPVTHENKLLPKNKTAKLSWKQEENKPMSLTSRLRELKKSKEEKLRTKYNVTDNCGKRTDEGTEMLLDLLFEANLTSVIDPELAKLDAEDKKDKK